MKVMVCTVDGFECSLVTVSSATVPMTRPEVHNGAGLVAFGARFGRLLGGGFLGKHAKNGRGVGVACVGGA